MPNTLHVQCYVPHALHVQRMKNTWLRACTSKPASAEICFRGADVSSRGCMLDVKKKPIGKDDTKESRIWVLYRDWLYREKISMKLGRAKLEEHVGGIEGL